MALVLDADRFQIKKSDPIHDLNNLEYSIFSEDGRSGFAPYSYKGRWCGRCPPPIWEAKIDTGL